MQSEPKATAVPLQHVTIDDAFWSRYIQLIKEVGAPLLVESQKVIGK